MGDLNAVTHAATEEWSRLVPAPHQFDAFLLEDVYAASAASSSLCGLMASDTSSVSFAVKTDRTRNTVGNHPEKQDASLVS